MASRSVGALVADMAAFVLHVVMYLLMFKHLAVQFHRILLWNASNGIL